MELYLLDARTNRGGVWGGGGGCARSGSLPGRTHCRDFLGSKTVLKKGMEKRGEKAVKKLQTEVKIVKNGRRRGLWRGLESDTKNVPDLYPPKPSKVGWRVGGSTVFTCSPDPQKASNMRSKSTQNRGPGSQKALRDHLKKGLKS